MKTIVERFRQHEGMGFGVPTLRVWKHSRTMCIERNDCGMCDHYAFTQAVDSVSMNAELLEVWKLKPQRGPRASFSHGNTGGYIVTSRTLLAMRQWPSYASISTRRS